MNYAMTYFAFGGGDYNLYSVLLVFNELVLKVDFVLRLLEGSLSIVLFIFPVEEDDCIGYFYISG
jgi:hypothetical protein